MRFKSVGMTGSRVGLTGEQKVWVTEFLLKNQANVLHHGDCVGADYEVATMFHFEDTFVIAHPGDINSLRGRCRHNDLTLPMESNLVRNRIIVNVSKLMLALPNTFTDTLRSGTWHTIRYAKKMKVPVDIVYPDGTHERQ